MTTKIRSSTLANTAVNAGTYGGSSNTAIITIDPQGRITSASNTTFTGNYGVTITAVSNTINIATPQDLRTSSVPQFFNLTLSNALPVTSGGTGVTTSTGSGNNVLSNNATLVTPILGTPQSGNLTNCTNYGGAITSSQVLTALGYTPYSSGNPTGYITSSGTAALAGNLTGTPNISIGTQTLTYNSGAYTSANVKQGIQLNQTFTTIGTFSTNISSVGIFASNAYSISANTQGSVQQFNFDASGNFSAPGNVTAYSDARLKTNVQTITGALDKVSALRGVSFDKDGQRGLGVIAQEIQQVLPEVVHENDDEDKTLSVAYGNISGVLIEAIKELTQQVNELKAEIDILKGNK